MTGRPVGPVALTDRDWLLARAVCADEPASTASWRDWRRVADVDGVPDHAHPFLVALGARTDGALPAEEAGRLRGLHRRSWYVNQRLGAFAIRTAGTLGDAGVPTLLFGALAIASHTGGEPGWRHSTGIDLLVRSGDLDVAMATLTQHEMTTVRRPDRRRTSVAVLVDTEGNTARLHRVLPHVGVFGTSDDDVWRRSTRLTVNGGELESLSAPDALVLAAAPRLGSEADDAVWPIDVHRLVAAHGAPHWWALVVTSAARTPWGRAIGDALRACRDRLGTDVPADVLDQLGRLPSPPAVVRLEHLARRLRARVSRPQRPAARPAPPGDA